MVKSMWAKIYIPEDVIQNYMRVVVGNTGTFTTILCVPASKLACNRYETEF